MMIQTIRTFPIQFAQKLASDARGLPYQVAMISIRDTSDDVQLFGPSPSVLSLQFDDVTQTLPAQLSQLRGYQLMTFAQAAEAVDFLVRIKECYSELFVHCVGGVARSGAVALFARDLYGLDLDKFISQNSILPNEYVYELLHSAAKVRNIQCPKTDLGVFSCQNNLDQSNMFGTAYTPP